MSEVRSSGVRKPERLLVGATTREFVRQTKAEGGSTWRVYVKDWLFDARFSDPVSCHNDQLKKYNGRLHPDDMRVRESEGSFVSEVRRWTTAGEYKEEDIGRAVGIGLIAAGEDPETVRVVERNTKDEQVLRDYGRILLPAGV